MLEESELRESRERKVNKEVEEELLMYMKGVVSNAYVESPLVQPRLSGVALMVARVMLGMVMNPEWVWARTTMA